MYLLDLSDYAPAADGDRPACQVSLGSAVTCVVFVCGACVIFSVQLYYSGRKIFEKVVMYGKVSKMLTEADEIIDKPAEKQGGALP